MPFKLKIIGYLLRFKWMHFRYAFALERLQAKRWKTYLKILSKSPFYSKFLEKKTKLEDFPIINKQAFMENFDTINTCDIALEKAMTIAINAEKSRNFSPMINGITVGLSSGTSGNRGIFLASENERAQWVAAVIDRIIGFQLRKRKVAFFLRANSNLYNSVASNLLQFEFFDLLIPTEKHIDSLNQLQPNILVAQPSCLIELAKSIESSQLEIRPEKVISVAEVLYPEDKKYLEKIFKQTIHQVYQCTEGLLASTCKAGNLHFHEDYLIIEKNYLDEEKNRFHPVITDLMRSTQPILRYELNDIIHELKNCPCGSKMTAISQIEGRSDDKLCFLNIEGVEISIYPDFFRRAIILADSEIQHYMLIQKSKTRLDLFVEGSETLFEKAKNEIQTLLEFNDCLRVEIKRLEASPFERGTKLRRIKNESI
jgi:putative adenylate-forming enzyme